MDTTKVKVGRNEPCPCGSGAKYKKCCLNKAFDYVRTPNGETLRQVPLNDEARELLKLQLERFKQKFGREPGPEDRIFWEEPEHVEHHVVEAMKTAGIDPMIIYAYEKTGLLVTESNQNLIPEKDLADWHAACDEYEELYGQESTSEEE